jgi:hypothetical protein
MSDVVINAGGRDDRAPSEERPRGWRGISVQSLIGELSKQMSPRSRRQLSPASRVWFYFDALPGVCSQSLAAPQAQCCHPLRGLDSLELTSLGR